MKRLFLTMIIATVTLGACAAMNDLAHRDPDVVRRCGAVPASECENGL